MRKKYPFVIRLTLVLFLLSLIIVMLIVGRDFLYPVCLALLFSFLLYPITNLLEKWRLPRVAAILISIISAIAIFGGGMFLLYQQMTVFIDDFPELKKHALDNIDHLQLQIDDVVGPVDHNKQWWLREKVSDLLNNSDNIMATVFNATTGTIVKMGLQPVFIFFMLYYRERFARFVYMIAGRSQKQNVEVILGEVSLITKSYISGVFIVVLILCFVNSFGLMIVGVEYAIMFGILSALMNFIPYFGTLIGAAIPLLYTLVSSEPKNAIGVIILFVIIQFLENNILTPSITGGRVAINPLFTILIIIAGGMIWGIPGMFMSVPFAGMFKVICHHYRYLRPIAFVMSKNKGDVISYKLDDLKKWFTKSK
ncbi:AI-2E family transporter [Fulvivirga sediminis]|uniref:AI-2E family transporter n=1 Tax=Fulvivirga sediminis TaxID=2803949 RepID=A0A937JZK7_9BACT|nr:AI-2E family transporter [Fulvivirga sediminis]MBL3657503.1 AI-2E family transporter [Fulvivirga sediminis]